MTTTETEGKMVVTRTERIAEGIADAQCALQIACERLDDIGDEDTQGVAALVKIVWRSLNEPYRDVVELGKEIAAGQVRP